MSVHPRTAAYVGGGAALGLGLLSAAPTALAVKIRRARKAVRSKRNPDNVPPQLDGVYGTGDRTLRLLVMGDSLAAGLGSAENTGTVVANAAEALSAAEGARIEVTSTAVVASRLQDLPRQLSEAHGHTEHYDYALIIAGANDVYHLDVGPADVEDSLGCAVRILASNGATVVAVTCPDMSIVVPFGLKSLATLLSIRLQRMQSQVASAAGAHTIPCHPDLPKAVRTVKTFFCSDRFHPSPDGYAAVSEHLTPAVLNIIAQGAQLGGLRTGDLAKVC